MGNKQNHTKNNSIKQNNDNQLIALENNDFNNQNYIIANLEIKKWSLKERIINSYEKNKREETFWKWGNMKEINNENLIKDSEIYIDNKKIEFNYYYNFSKEGNYTIKYIFKKPLTSTNFMFYNCRSLKSKDLSHFDTQNVTNMECMFYGCNSLETINFTNFNTQNVINMEYMFNNCISLTSLNLSNFNTQRVTNKRYMFVYCKSSTSLDLSNFDTQDVKNMENMFYDCISLISLNLLNFDTKMLLIWNLCSVFAFH